MLGRTDPNPAAQGGGCKADQLADHRRCVLRRQRAVVGGPQQFQRRRCGLGERIAMDALDHRPMLSAFSLSYLVILPVGGWIADQIGPRRTLAGAMAGWSLWVLLTPIAPTVLWLTATFRVLLGVFEAPYIPAIAAAVARAIPSGAKRGRFAAFISRVRSSARQSACSLPA